MIKKDTVLKIKGKEINFSKATKVFMGKDHECRCGCQGHYHYAGTKGFNIALGRLKTAYWEGELRNVDACTTYVNIPYGDPEKDRCFCFYFD